MKKNLFIVLAVAGALASCSNDETLQVVQHQPQAIGFSSYVDKATRADVTLSTLQADGSGFNVWGEVSSASSGTAHLFEGEVVTWNSSKWAYANIRYWLPSTSYAFTAIGPKNATGLTFEDNQGSSFTDNLHGTITMDNSSSGANCEVDLVHAYNCRTTNATLTSGVDDADVSFTFNHILSKVRVVFKNGFSVDGQNIKVTGVKIFSQPSGTLELKGLAKDAVLSSYSWTPSGESTAKNCTAISAYGGTTLNSQSCITIGKQGAVEPVYLIPNQETINIEFAVQLYSDSQAGSTYAHTGSAKATATISGGLEPGKSYILTAEINAGNIDPNPSGGLKSITFTASVTGWGTDIPVEVTVKP